MNLIASAPEARGEAPRVRAQTSHPGRGARENAPGFFVVGAPRCGTTALYTYLRKHPRVFMPDYKEPEFFSRDFDFSSRVRTMEEYLALFDSAEPGAVIGEASVFYLSSEQAAGRIAEFRPEAKIVAMLRNPVEQMYSNQRHNLRINVEDVFDFGRALELEGPRKQGEHVPNWVAGDVAKLYYRRIATYSVQLERYFRHFRRDQVHVIIYDDFVSDPTAVYARLCEFLGIDPDPGYDQEPVNENQEWRAPWLLSMIRNPPQPLIRAARLVLPGRLRARIFQGIWNFSLVRRRRDPLDSALRASLAAEFREEVERLSALLDRDLTHWCRA